MNDALALLEDTAEKLFADMVTPALIRASEAGGFATMLWQMIEKLGLPRALLSEEKGGAGEGFAAAFPLMRALGFHAAPVPLAETLLAVFLLDKAEIEAPEGVLALADGEGLALARDKGGVELSGTLEAVPYARHAAHLVLGLGERGKLALALVDLCEATLEPFENLAGEPRDRVRLSKTRAHCFARTSLPADAIRRWGALMRAGAMAGAFARVLELSLAHARTRRQFGKPLGDFQAVQHMLAELAEETAAATVAAEAAFQAAESASAEMAIAAAKIRASTAADKGAALAHQIHGALGFTAEHTLHLFTRRLWAWRDDYGDASHHARALGRLAAQRGADALWPFLSPSPGR